MSVHFDGASYLELSSKVVSQLPCTIVAWVKVPNNNAVQFVATQTKSTSDNYITASVNYNGVAVTHLNSGGYASGAYISTSLSTSWIMLVAEFTSTSVRDAYYGTQSGTGDGSTRVDDLSTHDRFVIGARHFNNSAADNFSLGDIAEVHIYNTALTSAQRDSLRLDTAKPETITGWVDGWKLLDSSDLTSIGGTRTLTATGTLTTGSTHPISRSIVVTNPSMSGNITATNITASSVTLNWPAATAGTYPVTGYQYSVDTGSPNWQEAGNVTTYNVSGLTGSTLYNIRVRAHDGNGNYSTILTNTFTTSAPSVNPPTMTTGPTVTNLTSSGMTISWGAATAGSNAITGYQYSVDTGTASWSEAGNVTTVNVNSGISASTAYTIRVRAHDGATPVNYAAPISTTATTPAAPASTSYIDMGTDACDNIQSGLMPSFALTAVVMRRDDLSVAKQVVTGITTTSSALVPRFQVSLPVGTPVHVVFISAADNTVTGIASDKVTVS